MTEEQTKHTIRLMAGDYSRLQAFFPSIGANAVIRKLVRDLLNKMDTKPDVSNLDIDL